MKLAAKPEGEKSEEEIEKHNEFNKEARRLESTGRLHVPPTFRDELETMLEQVGAYVPDRVSGGVVSRNIIQAEFESNYMIAYLIRTHQSTLVSSRSPKNLQHFLLNRGIHQVKFSVLEISLSDIVSELL